jgi:hypothetical protein
VNASLNISQNVVNKEKQTANKHKLQDNVYLGVTEGHTEPHG